MDAEFTPRRTRVRRPEGILQCVSNTGGEGDVEAAAGIAVRVRTDDGERLRYPVGRTFSVVVVDVDVDEYPAGVIACSSAAVRSIVTAQGDNVGLALCVIGTALLAVVNVDESLCVEPGVMILLREDSTGVCR